jgi:hypothetical protein
MRNASQKKQDYSEESVELFTETGLCRLNTFRNKKVRILK